MSITPFVTNEFSVVVESLPINVNPLANICDPTIDAIPLISNFPGGTWSISGSQSGAINQSPSTLSVSKLTHGNYTVGHQYISSPGCVYQASQTITIDLLVKPIIHASGDLCSGPVQIRADNVDQRSTIEWLKGNSSASLANTSMLVEVTAPGNYFAKVQKGTCSAKSNTVHVDAAKDSLFVPNLITPNGDSYNDEFQVTGQNLNNFYMMVINRNGNQIFSTNDATFRWSADGISSGIYFWYASYSNCSNELTTQKGWLSVLK